MQPIPARSKSGPSAVPADRTTPDGLLSHVLIRPGRSGFTALRMVQGPAPVAHGIRFGGHIFSCSSSCAECRATVPREVRRTPLARSHHDHIKTLAPRYRFGQGHRSLLPDATPAFFLRARFFPVILYLLVSPTKFHARIISCSSSPFQFFEAFSDRPVPRAPQSPDDGFGSVDGGGSPSSRPVPAVACSGWRACSSSKRPADARWLGRDERDSGSGEGFHAEAVSGSHSGSSI